MGADGRAQGPQRAGDQPLESAFNPGRHPFSLKENGPEFLKIPVPMPPRRHVPCQVFAAVGNVMRSANAVIRAGATKRTPMISYSPRDDVGPLEDWPFDNPASDYVIVEGTPRASGRIEAGGPGHATRYGIWRCSKGVFTCTEQGDELMTVLQGRCRLTNHTSGEDVELGPGDSLFVKDGSRVTWEIAEDITKVFFGHKSGGY